MDYKSVLFSLYVKDVKVLARSPREVTPALALSILVGVVIAQHVSLQSGGNIILSTVALSLTLLFTALIAASLTFIRERDVGTLDVLLTSPIPPSALFIEKIFYAGMVLQAVNLIVVSLVEIVEPQFQALPMLAYGAGLAVFLAVASAISSLIGVYLETSISLLTAIIAVLSTPMIVAANANALLGVQLLIPTGATLAATGAAFAVIVTLLSGALLE